jgi:soluble lytic murein transglycosylase
MIKNTKPGRRPEQAVKDQQNRGKTFLKVLFLLPAIIFIFQGCSSVQFDFDLLEEKSDENMDEKDDIPFDEIEDTGKEKAFEYDESKVNENDTAVTDPHAETTDEKEDKDINDMRRYFSEAVKHFGDGSYIIAEYYLHMIEDTYLTLQDHIFYYLAKSLLMQEKYEQAKEYYERLLYNFPNSIWIEKSALELADIYYLTQEYQVAEEKYTDFINMYLNSEYLPYSIYMRAACQEIDGRASDAFTGYKKVWLEHPSSEYSDISFYDIKRMEEEGTINTFLPSAEELFARGELLFGDYLYHDAIEQFTKIIEEYPSDSYSPELHSSVCFKIGMSYYNLGQYDNAREWLSVCYEQHPESNLADDVIFFLGRVYTNLDDDPGAVSYYQELLSKYPSSNYGDDALYRMGRIYSINNDVEKAIENFRKVFDLYPSGDKTDEALWELGWIYYKSGDYNSAKETFSDIANIFRGTTLEEKALYWLAKCNIKIGDMGKAEELCSQIVDIGNYSYYTFSAMELCSSTGEKPEIQAIDPRISPEDPGVEKMLPGIFENLDRGNIIVDGQADHITKAVELIKLNFNNSASIEIEAGSDILKESPGRVLEIATLYFRSDDYSNCLRLIYGNINYIKKNLSEDYLAYTYYLYYPYGFRDIVDKYSKAYELDPLFVLAVIRQESSFKKDAGSYAGARGLMQIMPSTGSGIARQLGIEDFSEEMLLDPEININLGTYYLRRQLDNFSNDLVYCLGAYNGGPASMSDWINRFGPLDEDEFIENITFLETKEYIKRVLGNYYFYQMLYRE